MLEQVQDHIPLLAKFPYFKLRVEAIAVIGDGLQDAHFELTPKNYRECIGLVNAILVTGPGMSMRTLRSNRSELDSLWR